MLEPSERAKLFNLIQGIEEKLGRIAKATERIAEDPVPPGKQRIKADVDRGLFQDMVKLQGEPSAKAARDLMIEKFTQELDAAIGYEPHPILPRSGCRCSNGAKGDKDDKPEAKPGK